MKTACSFLCSYNEWGLNIPCLLITSRLKSEWKIINKNHWALKLCKWTEPENQINVLLTNCSSECFWRPIERDLLKIRLIFFHNSDRHSYFTATIFNYLHFSLKSLLTSCGQLLLCLNRKDPTLINWKDLNKENSAIATFHINFSKENQQKSNFIQLQKFCIFCHFKRVIWGTIHCNCTERAWKQHFSFCIPLSRNNVILA